MHNIYTANSRMCYRVHLSPVIPAEGTRSGSTACFSSAPCLGSCGSTVDDPGRSCSEQCAAGKPQACIPEAAGLYPWARCGPFTFFDILKLEFCHNDHWLIPLSSFFPVNPFTVWDSTESIDCFLVSTTVIFVLLYFSHVALQLVLTCVGHCQVIGTAEIKVRQYSCYQTIMFVVSCFPPPFPHSVSLTFPVSI